MERLTKTVNGVVTYIGTGNEFGTGMLPAELSSGQIRVVMNRLSAYEDSGLEPEQVIELKNFTQGGIHKVDDGWKHVQDLLQAENEGRLVVLPKPSDTDVYIVYYDECGAGGMCLDYPYCDDCKDHTPKIREAKLNCTMVNSIGKTVFLTREEAESAMKEGQKLL